MQPKDFKQEFLSKLHDAGIPEFGVTLKSFQSNPDGALGCYRALSQFRKAPIITVDIARHETVLKEDEADGGYMFTEELLKSHVMDTLMHEYGHVIEEFIHVDANKTKNYKYLQMIEKFEDMEDFAETFARWRNGRETLSKEQQNIFNEVINYFVDTVFEPEPIAWVRQEKWKRELDYFLDHNEKSFEKYKTQEGAFDNCRKVSYAVAERMQGKGFPVKVLRASEYNGSLQNAHPKWKKLGGFFIVHYVIEFNNEWILDLTSRQFNLENPERLIIKTEDFKKSWDVVSVDLQFSKELEKVNKLRNKP
jgi:hypothetical protein